MIEEWTLGNFKSVANRVSLDLKPLTLLVGPNSSGKSTVLQSILAVAQTLGSPSGRRPLILNGELVRLGFVSDVMHEGKENSPLELGFKLGPGPFAKKPNRDPLHVMARFEKPTVSPSSTSTLDLQRTGISKGRRIKMAVQRIPPGDRSAIALSLHRFQHVPNSLKERIKRGHFNYVAEEFSTTAKYSYQGKTQFPMQVSVRNFLPGRILEPYNEIEERIIEGLREAAEHLRSRRDRNAPEYSIYVMNLSTIESRSELDKRIREAFRKSLREVEKSTRSSTPLQEVRLGGLYLSRNDSIVDWLDELRRDLSSRMRSRIARQLISDAAFRESKLSKQQLKTEEIGLREASLPNDLSRAMKLITDSLTKRLRYLGPLRDTPRAIHGFPTRPESKNIGLKGEYTAAVLERYKTLEIAYPVPPVSGKEFGETKKGTLIQGIVEWLKHMGLVEGLATRDRGKMGFALTVQSPHVERKLDLTNVGVGVSQVLPTLTMSLLAPENAILLLEQPELHLHPKVQSILGDFLLAVAHTGTQCIVETHSEYIVNRIRLRIAEAEGSLVRDMTRFYFVELGEKGGSQFREVKPNEYGAIMEWPRGFFDQGPNEAQLIMEAAMNKRMQS